MKLCKCGQPAVSNSGYCRTCKNSYSRLWRLRQKTRKRSLEQHFRDNARATLRSAIRRGKIKQEFCQQILPSGERCNRHAKAVMPDPTRPLHVRWFCYCHRIEWLRHYPKKPIPPAALATMHQRRPRKAKSGKPPVDARRATLLRRLRLQKRRLEKRTMSQPPSAPGVALKEFTGTANTCGSRQRSIMWGLVKNKPKTMKPAQ